MHNHVTIDAALRLDAANINYTKSDRLVSDAALGTEKILKVVRKHQFRREFGFEDRTANLAADRIWFARNQS